MYPHFKELFAVFNAKSVRYLVVGGYAVSLHVQPRTTKDLDLFLKADLSNAQAIYQALAEFGAPISEFSPGDFENPQVFFRFGREPQAVDLLFEVPGVDFDAAWDRRIEVVVDDQVGTVAHFMSREDLISSKLASGRLRDLADVEDLRASGDSQAPGA